MKKGTIKILCMLLISSTCTAKYLDFDGEEILGIAVRSGNLEKTQEILSQYRTNQNIVFEAVSAAGHFGCNGEVVEWLVQNKYKLKALHEVAAKIAVNKICPTAFKAIAPQLSSHDIAVAGHCLSIQPVQTYVYKRNYPWSKFKIADKNGTADEILSRFEEMGKVLIEENYKRCDGSPVNMNCEALIAIARNFTLPLESVSVELKAIQKRLAQKFVSTFDKSK